MKPIFTIHAGEYLVGNEIQKHLKGVNVWLPSKDKGIDLLLTNSQMKCVSIQVKFSKDFNATHAQEAIRANIRASGWWKLNKGKIEQSEAQFWVFVLYGFEKKTCDFIVIERNELVKFFRRLGRNSTTIHCYITVTPDGTAFETRDLSREDMVRLSNGTYKNPTRNLTKYLNDWNRIARKLNITLKEN